MSRQEVEAFTDKLLQVDTDEGSAAWALFLLNPDLVSRLSGVMTPAKATEILEAGQRYDGKGWNTGKASKKVYELTGVALVSNDLSLIHI